MELEKVVNGAAAGPAGTAADIPAHGGIVGDAVRISVKEYPCNPGGIPPVDVEAGEYRVRFARSREDLDEVCRLRFEVYNLEMDEGLESSFEIHRDIDEFDAQCHHLMVIHRATGRLAGTYRMQTGSMAQLRKGFYSASEFDLSAFPRDFLDRCVEVGRACIHREHRNGRVLQLLWKGLARYMDWNGKRWLFGCCSLASQEAAEGRALYQRLALLDYLHAGLRAAPLPGYACEAPALAVLDAKQPQMPRLFEGYLNLGGRICGEPALDRRFKTIDFLVVLDIRAMPPGIYRKMLA
jgi:putative hemolysin